MANYLPILLHTEKGPMPAVGDFSRAAGQFLQVGAGAVPRTYQAKMRDTVSVKDFGAMGNGVAADSAAIQAAVDSMPNGGGLYFPAGTYNIDATIEIPMNSRWNICGDGPASILMAVANIGDIIRLERDIAFTGLEDPQDVTITGLAFQMDVTAAYDIVAIQASFRHQLIVDTCFFGRFIGTTAPNTTTADRYTKFARMTALRGDTLNNASFINNLLVQINRGVTLLNDIDDVIIAHNGQSYCNDALVHVTTGNKLMIHSNSVEETFFGNAITLTGVVDSLITGNTFSECYQNSGIVLVESENCIISSNNCYSNQLARGGKTPDANAAGIRLVNGSNRNVIAGNRSGFAPQRRGVYIQTADCVGNLVTLNNLRGNSIAAFTDSGTSTIVGTNIT